MPCHDRLRAQTSGETDDFFTLTPTSLPGGRSISVELLCNATCLSTSERRDVKEAHDMTWVRDVRACVV